MNIKEKEIIKLGIQYLTGVIIGISSILFLGFKYEIFAALLVNLIDWNLNGISDILNPLILPATLVIIGCFFTLFLYILIKSYLNRKKKQSESEPSITIIIIGFIVGVLFIPIILIFVFITLMFMYLIWGISFIINELVFRHIIYIALNVIRFLFEKVMYQEFLIREFKDENYFLFTQTMLFFTLLPYCFRILVFLLERFLHSVAGNISLLFHNILNKITVNILRYATYTLALFTYILCYLWSVSVDITNIKEGLLLFIIADVLVYGIYIKYYKVKNKRFFNALDTLLIELERIQIYLVTNKLTKIENINSKIKLSPLSLEIVERYTPKGKHNDKINFIFKNLKKITAHNENLEGGSSFVNIYKRINEIQNVIRRYLDENRK